MRLISLLLLCVLFSACKKKQNFSSIKLIGHAGMGLSIQNNFYHDNSKESIDLALSMDGCSGVEVDVQMSLDGTLWLYHDPLLENETNISGCINTQTDNQLSNAHYNSVHKEKLIRLSDLNGIDLTNDLVFLDIRHHNMCINSDVNINDFINSLNKIDFVLSSEIELKVILKKSSWIPFFIDAGFDVIYETEDLAAWHNINSIYPAIKGLIVKNKKISIAQVNEIKSLNKEVYLFDMRAPKSIREALLKSPNAIITDDLRASILEKY